MTPLRDLRLTPAPRHLARTGLVAWARGRLGPVQVDGLAVRRTQRGRLEVAWPTRRDARGREHRLVWPVDRAVRDAIRAQVLAAVRPLLAARQELRQLARALPGNLGAKSAETGHQPEQALFELGTRHGRKRSAGGRA